MSLASSSTRSHRPSLNITPSQLDSGPSHPHVYSDAREHGYQGPTRSVRIARATSNGGGMIAKSEDGMRCVVAGRSSLRILRVSDTPTTITPDHRSAIGRGGHRIDASRNFWVAANFKVESVTTDVAWARANLDHKILTSARNGDLLMWDLNKLGPSKYEKRARDHIRSINKLALSTVVPYYCLTGSADGDLRIWDLRSFEKSLFRIRHVQAVRSAAFSPSTTNPLQVVVGLDNGSMYRWDLKMGHKGQLDRIPVAHSGPVLSLDWCAGSSESVSQKAGLTRQDSISSDSGSSSLSSSMGWIASGGMDRTVKVWDLNSPGHTSHISSRPIYLLSTSFPVRRALWRPDYECELGIISNSEFGIGMNQDASEVTPTSEVPSLSTGVDLVAGVSSLRNGSEIGNSVEIWDVRRGYLAKWVVRGSSIEGGVADISFRDSHALWAQHYSGSFSQLDLRHSYRPIDSISREAVSWDASGTLAFVSDRSLNFETPYDDVDPLEVKELTERYTPHKHLGDAPYKPARQNLGYVEVENFAKDMTVFERLASEYIYDGADKHTICGHNAKVAMDTGHTQAAQTWAVVQSLYDPTSGSAPESADTNPNVQNPLSPLTTRSPVLHHTRSAPAAIPTVHHPPNSALLTSHSTSSDQASASDPFASNSVNSPQRSSPLHLSSRSPTPPRSSTPMSGHTVSPVSTFSNLSGSGSAHGTMLFPRRPSATGLLSRPRQVSSQRRPSFATNPSGSVSRSLKHVGEGALDDSDSSGSAEEDSISKFTPTMPSVGEAMEQRPKPVPPSPSFIRKLSMSAYTASHLSPSPLSQVASRQSWTDEEDEDVKDEDGDTPSPASTDTGDSGGSQTGSVRLIAGAASRKTSSRSQTRSRKGSVVRPKSSSTGTSAALAPPQPSLLISKQTSQGSMRTVTGTATPTGDMDDGVARPVSVLGNNSYRSQRVGAGGNLTTPILFSLPVEAQHHQDSGAIRENIVQENMRIREDYMRRNSWKVVLDALEDYADQGDVQMCAMLALVCATELYLSQRRVSRFVESYIDLLSRMKLFSTTAYLRKYASIEEVNEPTKIQTTVYISCFKCEKQILLQHGPYCPSCKEPSIRCIICRLPVSRLAFTCAICAHGGHADCYQRYFMAKPIAMIPQQCPPGELMSRNRSHSRASTGTTVDSYSATESKVIEHDHLLVEPFQARALTGHSCPSGCGHFCWTSTVSGKLLGDTA